MRELNIQELSNINGGIYMGFLFQKGFYKAVAKIFYYLKDSILL